MYSQSKDRTNRIIRCNDITCTANAYTKVSTVVTSKAKGTLCFRQQRHALLSTYRVPRQRRQNFNHKNYATGLWSEVEQHQFLTGLMQYGWGQWKEIGTIITTRSNRQIKSHGQKLSTKYYGGEDILESLMNVTSGNFTDAVACLSSKMYPPNVHSVKHSIDIPTDSTIPTANHETNESNTLAGILCSMKHHSK